MCFPHPSSVKFVVYTLEEDDDEEEEILMYSFILYRFADQWSSRQEQCMTPWFANKKGIRNAAEAVSGHLQRHRLQTAVAHNTIAFSCQSHYGDM